MSGFSHYLRLAFDGYALPRTPRGVSPVRIDADGFIRMLRDHGLLRFTSVRHGGAPGGAVGGRMLRIGLSAEDARAAFALACGAPPPRPARKSTPAPAPRPRRGRARGAGRRWLRRGCAPGAW